MLQLKNNERHDSAAHQSTLPDLPRRNTQHEAKAGLRFRHWWEEHRPDGSFELKHARGKSAIPTREYKPKQRTFAQRSESADGILVRVSNGTPGTADYIACKNLTAYIVACYESRFYIVPYSVFTTYQHLSEADAKKECVITKV